MDKNDRFSGAEVLVVDFDVGGILTTDFDPVASHGVRVC
jgi:hypothetical protein